MSIGPILALLLLIVLKVITLETIRLGILGNSHLKPWEIIIIFFTTAYASISVDVTGIFDFLAYKIVYKAKGDGVKLFIFFYCFACILTSFTSNDIVILTLTPIIFYLGRHSNINVIPLLFAEFFGANTLSMLLYIGNPTNIIVGNALRLGFLDYTRIMWLPTIVATLANIGLLYAVFRKQITKRYTIDHKSRFHVRHWGGAVFSSVLLLAMLIVLAFSQTLGIPIWKVTAIFAALFMVEDLAFSIFFTLKELIVLPIKVQKELQRDKRELFGLYGIPEKKNEFWIAFERVPWKILPFILSCFIFVQGLNQYGVVDWLAKLMAGFSQTTAQGIFANGFLGLIMSNIINNQPMTIFLSGILVSKSFQVPPPAFMGSAYAIVIASNLGANITLIGALAGLMWEKILKSKGLEISYLDFMQTGLIITPVVFCLTLGMLYWVLG